MGLPTVDSEEPKYFTVKGEYAQSTPEKGASLTLQYAISALLDGIEKRRNLFVR
jgi:hypothetical protein